MLTTELMKKVRRIEIRTRRLVKGGFAGEYHSVFKGMGMEFDEVRPYIPGDEVRSIDWNVTARMGQPYIKRYIEARELTVILVVDVSGSGRFGSVGRLKSELTAELAAVFAFSATTNNDKVGLLIFSDRVELYIPPRKGRQHVLRLVRELLAFTPSGLGTNISLALETLIRVQKHQGIVFILSDFLQDPASYQRSLFIANRKHDVIAIAINDPLEKYFASVGLVALEDSENGERVVVDTSSQAWQRNFSHMVQVDEDIRERTFEKAGVDVVRVSTDTDYGKALTQFFNKRTQRIRH